MGLFSNEYVTSVGTSVSRVIQDDQLPNSLKSSVLTALVKTEDVVEHVLEGMAGSLAVKADRMYEYASANYTYGMPSGEFMSALIGAPEITNILTNQMGQDISIIYSHAGPRNQLHLAWELLERSPHGYNEATNTINRLTIEKGIPVYLVDIQIRIPAAAFDVIEPMAIELWGISPKAGYTPWRTYDSSRPHTVVVRDPDISIPTAKYSYTWLTTEPVDLDDSYVGVGSFTIAMTPAYMNSDHIQAAYEVAGEIRHWDYRVGSGLYPELDNLLNVTPNSESGTFFPFAYFRFNKLSEVTDQTTEAFRTSKRMLKYLGIDYVKVADAIDENPDIGNVEQAILMMGVPAYSENPLESRYLFDFFNRLFYSSDNQITSAGQAIDIPGFGMGVENTSSIVMQDARFKLSFGNNGIIKERFGGDIGPVGTYQCSTYAMNLTAPYTTQGVEGEYIYETRLVPIKVHRYRCQVAPGIYDELLVFNLKGKYHIMGEYFTTADDLDDILLVPLDRSITHLYDLPNREELYARSLHFVFNSLVITTVKWYQQEWFSTFLLIVAVIATVYTMGADGGALITAIVSGSSVAITAAAVILIKKILFGLIVSYVMKLFVKAVGWKIALIIAVILVLVGGGMQLQGGIPGAPWASELLSLGNGLAQTISADMQEQMQGLFRDMKDFDLLMDSKYKELEEANKLLQHNSWLSPTIFFGETPEDFYNRTVHSGNIGVVGIGAISSYVDIALTLPKIDESVGGN